MDAGALAANWQTLDALSGAASAGAAVKANAYGLGAGRVAQTLTQAGCRDFFVAHWSEAPEVLVHVPAAQIAVLHGPLNAADVAFAKATEVIPVLNSVAQARLWSKAGGGRCHAAVGVEAHGAPADAWVPLVSRARPKTAGHPRCAG